MKQKVIVWGAGGHAVVVADIIRSEGRYAIAGFLDDLNPGRQNKPFCLSQSSLRALWQKIRVNLH